MLKRHLIQCKVHISDFKEIKNHGNPRQTVLHNACGKAQVAARHHANAIVIGIDTIGVFRGKIIGKPKNRAHAKRMLKTLSGTAHRVISGLCVIDGATGKKHTAVEITKVKFREIGKAELEKYLDSGHWKGKAGAYAIQGRARGFVEKIEGELANVVGVPMVELKKILGRMRS